MLTVATMLPALPTAGPTVASMLSSGPILAYAPIGESVVSVCEWASSHGSLGIGAFVAVHTASVVICFPGTILFEIAAGFTFGIYQGTFLAWAAKVIAAMITFLASSGIARKALSDAGVEEAAALAFSKQPSLKRLGQNVEKEGARYTLLARLSPIPSWLNNYGLAFAGVRFSDYAPATALATLPPVLTHVYAGSLLPTLLTLQAGDGNVIPSTFAGSSLSGLSAVVSGLLLREVITTIITDEDTLVENSEEQPNMMSIPWWRVSFFDRTNGDKQESIDKGKKNSNDDQNSGR
mmetsp:Transcript_35171/g.42441  ORF Transcript_35171/g.42441 Transcript_35171/m.42441 type:complete len:293 (+) Transcript_35171:84-962(+)